MQYDWSDYTIMIGENLVKIHVHSSILGNSRYRVYSQTSEEAEYKQAYSLLRENLEQQGVRVPTLFKQYVEVCRPGGCQFLGFNLDPDFSDCIDAMILVHVDELYPKKRERYISVHDKKITRAA